MGPVGPFSGRTFAAPGATSSPERGLGYYKVRFARPDFAEMRGMAREYFSVGKWSVLNYQLALVRVQLFSWLIAAIAGLPQPHHFRPD